ncbi:calcium-binding protein 8 isoform X3 [Marmota flaviventris]|uniref:calcium-binding protein 8 isoform X3 n=1 Tax=Marmota flaviventris TaxID=93162 RepID=UPI003A8661BD
MCLFFDSGKWRHLSWEKMPFHHVTAGLLYKGNYLNRSLSAGSDSEQLANISVEELDEIREAFRVLDRDGNGFISKQELGMAMRSLGYMPSEVELAIIMQRLDMDGDGQVDFDEFMTILGPKLVSSEGRDGFLGNTIDSIFWQEAAALESPLSIRSLHMGKTCPPSSYPALSLPGDIAMEGAND